MAEPRENPYIYVTWLTKLIAGESQCAWASWFKAHHTYDKLPSDFNTAKWTADHNSLLLRRKEELVQKGYEVFTEDQNKFTLQSKTGISLGGKADIVALNDTTACVEDAKTGSPKNSDHIQVIIYMMVLPLAIPRYKDRKFDGRIVYKNNIVDIPHKALDEAFKERFKIMIQKIGGIGGTDNVRKVPSWGECRW